MQSDALAARERTLDSPVPVNGARRLAKQAAEVKQPKRFRRPKHWRPRR